MELKVLLPEDKTAITGLFSDVFTHEPWNDDWRDTKQLNAYITDLIGQSNSLALGYMDGSRLVGLSMGHIKHWYSGTEYFIDELCIDRSLQGQGFGSGFLWSMEAFLPTIGVSQIFLLTNRSMPAYRFYLGRGFLEAKDNVGLYKSLR